MFMFSFSYLICKYVHSALQQGTMNSKRTGWSTIGRGQRDPIANARAHLFVYDRGVICQPILARWTPRLTDFFTLFSIVAIFVFLVWFLFASLFLLALSSNGTEKECSILHSWKLEKTEFVDKWDLVDFVHPSSAEKHGYYEQANKPFSALSQASLVRQTLFHAFSKPSSWTLQTHLVHKMLHFPENTGLK